MEWGNQVSEKTGIVAGKKALNDLHYFLGKNGYKQVRIRNIYSGKLFSSGRTVSFFDFPGFPFAEMC